MPDADPSPDRRALLQQALHALDDMQVKLDRAQRAGREPIAIVGMSCRFPGAPSLDAYWQLLHDGGDAVSTYPADRVALVEASGVDFAALGDPTTWSGGFLDRIEAFDPQFFGIAPREAASMDPQQRMLLEVSWEALENAGIAPDSLAGSSTGVFVGITTNDYVQLGKLGGSSALDVYSATGGALNAAPGRVAYTLGLQGPTMAIDTACSSSLVALHQACQSLRAGDATMALAGGVNLLLMPEAFVCFEQWGMMAPDGRCKTFDAAANGFVRGEGCGVVVLKLLRDAVADGDRVLAVIRGSAVNQDGASSGLTVPNGPAQQAVLRRALDVAGVAPADVQYFEAHGTGTTLGDPIEVEAIGAVLRRGRRADQALVIGSVKTNIGHLESAAGIAGVIKVVLSMEHGEIPPHLHFTAKNPQIPWPPFPVVVPTELTPWPAVAGRRVAGVSAFGFSGTNAHVVLESAPPTPAQVVALATTPDPSVDGADPDAGAEQGSELVVLSGRGAGVTREVAGRLAGWLQSAPDAALNEVAVTSNAGRAHLSHRAAFVAGSTSALRAQLERFAQGDDVAGVTTGRARHRTVGFLFSGQGSQWLGMGRGLHASEGVFRAALDRCESVLASVWGGAAPALTDVLWGTGAGAGLLDRTEHTQPALFALEWSLAQLWGSWGVLPRVVLGHSVGGLVAATVAGVFSVEDGLRLVAERGRLMGALPAGGVMAAVLAPVDAVEEVLAALPGDLRALVTVAAVNGAAHTVVSGAQAAVERVVGEFAARRVPTNRLVVSHAFHSPLMEPVLASFGEVVAGLQLSVPSACVVVSDVSGLALAEELTDPNYWVRQIVAPVRFADGVAGMRAAGVDVFVEVGPHPVLTGMVAADGVGDDEVLVASLRRGRAERGQVLAALGAVHVAGVDVDWRALDRRGATAGCRRLGLPTYPFQRQPHWVPPVAMAHGRRLPADAHPLLGTRTDAPSLRATIYETEIRPDSPAWLADHRLSGTIVFPGSAYLEMILAASHRDTEIVTNVSIREALVLADDAVVTMQTVVHDRPGGRDVEVVSTQPAIGDGATGWTVHAVAELRPRDVADHGIAALHIDRLDADFPDAVDVDAYYALLRSIGLTYGPTFRGLTRLRRRDGAAAGLAVLAPTVADCGRMHLHPALLDACFHVLGVALAPLGEHVGDDMLIPVAVDGLRLHRSGVSSLWCVVTVVDDGAGRPTIAARVDLYGLDGGLVATIDRLEVRRTPRALWQRATAARHPLYEVTWASQPRADVRTAPATCVVFGGESDAVEALVAALDAAGWRCTSVVAGDETAEIAAGRWTLAGDDADGLVEILDRVHAADVAETADATETADTAGGAVGVPRVPRPVEIVFLAPSPDSVGDVLAVEPTENLRPAVGGALTLAKVLTEHPVEGARLWLVTRGAQSLDGEAAVVAHGALWGFGRVLANEQPQLGCRLVDLDPAEPVDAVDELVAELLAADVASGIAAPAEQVALRGRRRSVARLARYRVDQRTSRRPPYALALGARGSLEQLSWEPAAPRAPGAGEVEVEVRCTGVNFRDVLNVLGMYPGDPGAPGLEVAGVVAAVGTGVVGLAPGDHVMGIAPHAFDSHVVTRADLLVVMPAALTFAEAATVPIAFLTAAYGLRRLAGLRAGERVLIHAAAGGVGQAAVQIAQRLGAEVYATVGSPDKRRHLEALGVRHIYGSRTLDFADQVLADTDGRGVDVVLNSLSDDFVDRSFDALATGGRFLEIGKRGVWSAERAATERPDAAYHLYDLADFLAGDAADLHAALHSVAADLAGGALVPLPLRAFPAESVEDAFRFMAQARHIGKVVITHRPTGPVVRPDGTYLVTGGLGGLGLAVAGWLVEHQAGSIVLVGRRPPSLAAASTVDALRAGGADVRVVAADVATPAGVEAVMTVVASTGGALRGVVHAAGIVDDGVVAQQTWDRFRAVIAPKHTAAVLLDRATRHLDLDHFVLFSSASAVLGAPGQSGYAAANAALDAFAHRRRAEGRTALSVDWGAWGDAGMATRLDERERQRLAVRGVGTIASDAALDALGALLATSSAQVAVLPIDWSTMLAAFPAGAEPPLLANLSDAEAGEGDPGGSVVDIRAEIVAAQDDGREVLEAFVRDQIVRVLGLDPAEHIDPRQGLTDIGMDSLMAVELSNRLRSGLGLTLPSTVAFEHPTLRLLSDHLAAQIIGDREPVAASPSAEAARRSAGVEELALLTDEEAADRLLRELEDSGY